MNPLTTDASNNDILGTDDIQVEGKVWVRPERKEEAPRGCYELWEGGEKSVK
jgi:hypothetical protein